MSLRRRATAAALSAALSAALLAVPLAGAPAVGAAGSPGPLASSVAVDWQRIAVRTVYVERGSAPPLGALYLAFTSLAVHDAARKAQRHGTHAAAAAVAVAAHDVLKAYFPASSANLHADLAASLASIKESDGRDLGEAIGGSSADAMIASRVGDGRNDGTIVYSKPALPGFWQPSASGMALPWLGYVDPVVDVPPVDLDGPDALTSAAYAAEYNEVREVGSTTSTTSGARTADQTAIARFFRGNPVLVYRTALCDLLDEEPLGLLPTTRLFARIDAASANSFIQTWRLKSEVGFWRPFQAIAGALDDNNPDTMPEAAWSPLVPNPPYSDYTSGHAAATAPFAQVVRQTLGDNTRLVLRDFGEVREYATLTELEYDALNARIWGGLHFRDAMDDAYHLGHITADRVMQVVR